MKLMLLIGLMISSMVAVADWQEANETQEIMVEVDGVKQVVTIDNETASELVSRNHTFYECLPRDGGWRRCSKRNGRCFGTAFPRKSQCERALHSSHDDD